VDFYMGGVGVAGRAQADGVDQLPLVGYIRVSTADQAENGAGLEAQRQTIEAACQRAGRSLLGIIEEQASGKSVKDRPELRRVLRLIARRRAGGIVAAKLDRLSRSVLDFAQLLDRSLREGWQVVVCDLAVDTATPEGEAMAYVLMAWAQFERRRIADRTRETLAVKRAQGVRLGRPSGLTLPVRTRILAARRDGAGWSQIAAILNADGVPTAHGGALWHAATVRYVCLRS
jgi:DNA invertase Pin-like site-specific DNA recombinase